MSEPRRWELVLPAVPQVNQNRRGHWGQKAPEIARWRAAGALLVRQLGIPPCARIRVTATIYRRNLGVADEPNDWERLKPVIDGITDAGVVPKDTRRYVVYGPCEEAHGKSGVRVIIEALEENA